MTIHHFSRMNLFLNAFNVGYKHNYVKCMRGQEQVIGIYPTYSNKKCETHAVDFYRTEKRNSKH